MRRLPGLLIVFVATACCVPPPSAAAVRPGSQLGYAIIAVGFKSYFVFDTRAGASVRGTLRIQGLTPGAKTIQVSPVDVTTASTGGLQYGDGSPSGEGRWLKLAVRRVRLSGAGSASVPFTVRVPAGARSGDHFVGIIALDRRILSRVPNGRGAIRLRLIPRLAMTVQLRLPGPRTSELAVGGAKIEVAPSGASLAFPVSNPGNTLIPASTGDISVTQGGLPLFTRTFDLAAFVPDTRISYRVPWEGRPVEGTYRVKGELQPAGAAAIAFDQTVTFSGNAISTFRRETGRAATASSGTPGLLIGALVLAVVAAAGFGVAYARMRRRLKSP